jgi:hypothetical protein
MLDPSKVRAVLSYLQGEFPEQTVHDSYDTERCAHSFRIDNDSVLYLVTVSREFLDDHGAAEIPSLLRQYALADMLKKAGRSRVLVTNTGRQIVDE